MNRSWRRIVSTTVAIVFVMTSLLVCAPPVVSAPEGHCKPAAGMTAGCSHCPQKNVMDCCATSAPQPAVPQDGQAQQASGAAAAAWAVHADAVIAPATLNALSLAKAVRAAPTHGYRSTDLPILNAVFLI